MNQVLQTLLADTPALSVLGVIALLAVVTSFFAWRTGQSTKRDATTLSARLVSILASRTPAQLGGREELLVRAVRDHIAYAEKGSQRFVTKDIDDERIEIAAASMFEHGKLSWLLRLGDQLTAIALVATFTLLGIVLTQDVTTAIQTNAGADAAASRNDALVHAFAKMGGKFFISAVGLLGAVAFRWARESSLKKIRDSIHALIGDNKANFISIEAHSYERSLSERATLQLGLNKATEEITNAVRSMSSIDVTVKDMGAEVAVHLSKLMKESIGDELAKNIGELRVSVETIAQHIEATLTEALNGQMQSVLKGLDSIRETVHDRAGGEVESLLDRMKDLLSGGFQSAQGDMADQMSALSHQLGELVTKVSEASTRSTGEAATRSEEMRGQMDALLTRTNEMVTSMQAAQETIAASSMSSAAHVRAEVAEAIATTRAATGDLDAQSRRVEASLEKVLSNLESALKNSTEVVAQFAQQSVGARELTRATLESAKQFAQGSNSIQQAASKFDENLRALQHSIDGQRASQQEFVRVIPDGVRKVQERLTEQTKELSSAWSTLQQALKTSVQTISTSLAEPIENLGEHVEALQRAVGSLPGANGARR